MNELTAEWVDKAEGDLATAQRELRARLRPNYDAVCFHAQQSAEKYLKALLQERAGYFPKTHNLVELLELCLPSEPGLELSRDLLVRLDRYAVRFRYPGESADRTEAKAAFESAKAVCRSVRPLLGGVFSNV